MDALEGLKTLSDGIRFETPSLPFIKLKKKTSGLLAAPFICVSFPFAGSDSDASFFVFGK
jgi:hypothetical protein